MNKKAIFEGNYIRAIEKKLFYNTTKKLNHVQYIHGTTIYQIKLSYFTGIHRKR